MGLGADVFSNGVSIGSGNTVDAWSLAIGSDSAAERKSVAAGHDVLLSGFRSLGAGENLTMDSDSGNSVIFGEGSTMTQSYAMFVSGMTNTSTRQNAGLIVGNYNSAWQPSSPALGVGDSNVILGCDNHINENPLTASLDTYGIVLMGIGNKTQQTQSWVMGMGNIGQTNTVTLGTYNQTVANAALIVGNGASDTARSNGLVVLQNGTVQIPSGSLQLGSESALTPTGATALFSSHLSTNGYLKNDNNPSFGFGVSNGAIISVGGASKASAASAQAIGVWSNASGVNAATYGFATFAAGNSSSAFGASSKAYGNSSVAVGNSAQSVANFSTALGYSTKAEGENSVAIGSASRAQNLSALAIGHAAYAEGNASASIGYVTQANGEQSYSIGYWTQAKSLGEMVIGRYNELDTMAHSSAWYWTERMFTLGNGEDAAHPSNAITTLKNGRTTLINKFWDSDQRTETPSNSMEASDGEALVVEGHAVHEGNTVHKGNTKLEGDTVLDGKVTLSQPQGDISMGIYN